MKFRNLFAGLALAALALAASSANATTAWTNWTSGTTGSSSGTASGTLGSGTVSYTGENECLNCYASNWSPASTWTGGSVTSAPPGNSGIQLWGGNGSVTDTITFSSPVKDPVIAIVSLGQGGINASFDFIGNPTFTLEGGGPSSAWGGSGLTAIGSNVYGSEGNGLVQFLGTYSSISWTNPTYEYYYAFTVGTAGVPEPASWSLVIMGLGGVGAALRLRRRKALAA